MWKFKSEVKEAKDDLLKISHSDVKGPQPVSVNMIYDQVNQRQNDYRISVGKVNCKNNSKENVEINKSPKNGNEISIEDISSWAGEYERNITQRGKIEKKEKKIGKKVGGMKSKKKMIRIKREMLHNPKRLHIMKNYKRKRKLKSTSLREVSPKKPSLSFDYTKDNYRSLNKTTALEQSCPKVPPNRLNITFDNVEFQVYDRQKIKDKNCEFEVPSKYYYNQNKQQKFPSNSRLSIKRLNDELNMRLRAKKDKVRQMAQEARDRIRERRRKEVQNIVNFLNKVKGKEEHIKSKKFVKEDYEPENIKTIYLPKFNKGVSFVRKKGEIKWRVGKRFSVYNQKNRGNGHSRVMAMSLDKGEMKTNRVKAFEILTNSGLLLPFENEKKNSHHFDNIHSKAIFNQIMENKMKKRREYTERMKFIKNLNSDKGNVEKSNRNSKYQKNKERIRSSSMGDNIIFLNKNKKKFGRKRRRKGHSILGILRIDKD